MEAGEPVEGRIKWFRAEKGFGFIERLDGGDIFFHQSQISETVQPGDKVIFYIKEGRKGPVATDIKKLA